MTYADDSERARFIAGLRALADFLEAHPLLPTPVFADVTVFPPRDVDEAMRTEIRRVAALLNAPTSTRRGHCETGRDFGPVSYRVVAVLADARARWDAVTAFADAVMPLIAHDTQARR